MSNLNTVRFTLTDLLGAVDYMIAAPLMPSARPQLRRLRPGEDFMPRLTVLQGATDDARRRVIEGGNPIGAEASLLIECLMHLERARQQNDRARSERWAAIAWELAGMVRGDLGELLDRQIAPMTASSGRFG